MNGNRELELNKDVSLLPKISSKLQNSEMNNNNNDDDDLDRSLLKISTSNNINDSKVTLPLIENRTKKSNPNTSSSAMSASKTRRNDSLNIMDDAFLKAIDFQKQIVRNTTSGKKSNHIKAKLFS